MLHVLLLGLVVWMAAGWVATIPFARVSFPRIFYPLVQEASYAAALALLGRGHFLRSSVAYLAGTWIWATLICFSYGGIHSPGALLYVSLPASRGLAPRIHGPPSGQRADVCSARCFLRFWR